MPDVGIVVAARNEAAILPATLPALLAQQYAGRYFTILADDGSTDDTALTAQRLASAAAALNFAVAPVPERPAGWAGKVWAMANGVRALRATGLQPAYWLFTDADITHEPDVVAALVATALNDRRDLVSLMVQLHCESRWEQLLIPAFVFFFAKLYPFSWTADSTRRTAGAAGGCILISDEMLRRIGGIESICDSLIDDCSLAYRVKAGGGRLRLELSTRSRSIRPYQGLDAIWRMVARSAYTQLDRSPAILILTVAGMLVLYALPPIAALGGMLRRDRALASGGFFAWALMSIAYMPILRLYGQPPVQAARLPLAAVLYTLMTIDSAIRHWRGKGGFWKGRYSADSAGPPAGDATLRNPSMPQHIG